VGPHLDGLFSQGGLGVVTRMTVFLQPLPRALTVVRFSVRDAARLPGIIDALRELRLDGTVDSAVGLWNDYRVVSTRMQFPWDLPGAEPPLSRAALRAAAGSTLDAWYGALSIYAPTRAQAEAHWRHVEALLGPRVDTMDVQRLSGGPRSGAELGDPADPALQFYQGVPHRQSLRSIYWRKRIPVPTDPDPDRDRCGVIWACPTVPLVGVHVDVAVRTADDVMPQHGFEPMLVVITATPRTAYLIPLVLYDRDVPGEDERAMACHDDLLGRMVSQGYLPHRLGNHSMGALPEACDDSSHVMAALRRALDPHDVLGPGRYDAGAAVDTASRK
jgi:4-cresol dehydrogenase (hydroxylating)